MGSEMCIRDSHYEFRVLPFGLCNAPATFQATMNELLKPFLRRFTAVFFDDILIYSPTLPTHVQHLAAAFNTLSEGEFYLRRTKCLFARRTLQYLGHIVSDKGIAPDPDKIQAMLSWPTPSTVSELRGFLGLTGFYRRFIRGYASIASPLTSLLRTDAFQWNSDAQAAFVQLQQAMTQAPVLAPPDFTAPFILETDASRTAMGAVLIQRAHPIAFHSKVFCDRLRRASTYVCELHAITVAVRKWRHYLLGSHFIIRTDHKSLRDLMNQTIQTPEQQTYLTKLLGYDYDIEYKSGATNIVADALSRIPTQGTFLSLSLPNFDFLDQLRQSLHSSQSYTTLLQDILQHPDLHPGYTTNRDMIFLHKKLWLPSDCSFIPALMDEFHSTPIGGHLGFAKTLHRIQENFYWPSMRQDIRRFIAHCTTCLQTKYETKKPAGLLHPLPIRATPWEELSLDFICGLPPSHGHSTILVIVDRFSKGIHLGALPAHYTAHSVATLFFNLVCKLHGLPRSLVPNRDPIFVSKFWRELFRLMGTKLCMSTAYHPETDGQTEVLNRVVEQYLRAFAHDHPHSWTRFLPLAEWSYNTSVHSGTGFSPFEVTFGKPPPSIPQYLQGSSQVEAVDTLLANHQHIRSVLQTRLRKAQDNMKKAADTHRREVSYSPGDWVYVRLRPYRQSSLAPGYCKLSKRYFGPFKIQERIGPVAYRLELPPHSRIHPVFHVSLLKLHPGETPTTPGFLPETTKGNDPIVAPLTILDWKLDASTSPPSRQVLVQWNGLSPEDST